MDSRQRVINSIKQLEVDRFPRNLWVLPSVMMNRSDEVKRLLEKFPGDFDTPVYRYGIGKLSKGNAYRTGDHTDAWGCVWHALEDGVCGEVKSSPLEDWDLLSGYGLPWELLKEADLSGVDKSCAESDKFMIVGTETRPFERMQFLRGTEETLVELVSGTSQIIKLRDMLHEFFIEELIMWSKTDVDAVAISDDWGTQTSLLVSPKLWREYFKPLYKDYCDIMHQNGKYLFFHSDGYIESIYDDLIEIGVDAVNSQLFCMDIEKLAEAYAGKIVFWGEIDRQNILPFGTQQDVREAVRRVAASMLRSKRTGVIAQCEWGTKVPYENIDAVFDEWGKV